VGLDTLNTSGCASEAHFLLYGADTEYLIGMVLSVELPDYIHKQGAANPVVPGLSHKQFLVCHCLEGTEGNNRVSWPYAKLLRLFFTASAYVDEHIILGDNLLALLCRQDVRWLGPNNPGKVPFMGFDNDPLRQKHLIPPATKGLELDEPLLGDKLDHEANFIHVARKHHTGFLSGSSLLADDATQVITVNLAVGLHLLLNIGADRAFVSWNTVDIGDLFEHR